MSTSENKIEQLSALLDGELDRHEATALKRQIETDPETAETYRRMKAAKSACAGLPRISAPESLRHRIDERIRQASGDSFFGRMRQHMTRPLMAPVYLAAASTVLVIALGVFMVLSSTDQLPGERIAEVTFEEQKDFANPGAPTDEEAMLMADEAPAPNEAVTSAEEIDSLVAETREAEPLTRTTAQAARRRTEAAPAMAGAPASGPMYRAEFIETYYQPGADRATFVNSDDPEYYTRQWGREKVFNPEAPAGSNENPIIETSEMLPPEMPNVDFAVPGIGSSSPILVQGDIHVGADGRVLSFEISGPPEVQGVINSFADQLQGHHLQPQYRNGQQVSLLYRFIAMIYPAGAVTE